MTEEIKIDCQNVYINTSETIPDKILEEIKNPSEKFLEIHSILGDLKAEILEKESSHSEKEFQMKILDKMENLGKKIEELNRRTSIFLSDEDRTDQKDFQDKILGKMENFENILKKNEKQIEELRFSIIPADPNDKINEMQSILGLLKTEMSEMSGKIDAIPDLFKKELLDEFRSLKESFETTSSDDSSGILTDSSEISIKEAIVGEWKMVSTENFEEYQKKTNHSMDKLTGNVKFEIRNGSLIRFKNGYRTLREGVSQNDIDELYIEDNHLKTFWSEDNKTDRFIQDGKLHVVSNRSGIVFARIYEKID